MSLPFTSSFVTDMQHCSSYPLPRRSMLIQCILQHHQICNPQAEPVKMNELFNGREDHPLIPSMPWYLTQKSLFQTEITPVASRYLDFTLMKPSTSPILPMRSSQILHSNTNATTRISSSVIVVIPSIRLLLSPVIEPNQLPVVLIDWDDSGKLLFT